MTPLPHSHFTLRTRSLSLSLSQNHLSLSTAYCTWRSCRLIDPFLLFKLPSLATNKKQNRASHASSNWRTQQTTWKIDQQGSFEELKEQAKQQLFQIFTAVLFKQLKINHYFTLFIANFFIFALFPYSIYIVIHIFLFTQPLKITFRILQIFSLLFTFFCLFNPFFHMFLFLLGLAFVLLFIITIQ